MADGSLVSTSGQRYLKGLFLELNYGDRTHVVFTLKRRDHDGYPSLYRLYMEADDPTEYNFALANLDDWEHWTLLCQCTWFKPYIDDWRKELEIRTKARALLEIREISKDESAKERYQALKFILSAGWKDKPNSRGAGRPSKDEIKRAATEIAQSSKDIDDAYERIGLAN